MLPLVYWIVVAVVGFAASAGSAFLGVGTWQWLHRQRTDLVRGYFPEMIRDALLFVGLGTNLFVGILAAVTYGHTPEEAPVLLQSLITVGLLASATVLSAFACLNFWLRVRPRG